MPPAKSTRYRNKFTNFFVTLFNPPEEFEPMKKFNTKYNDIFAYAIWQYEKASSTDNLHIQGYIELKRPLSLSNIQLIYPTIHIEERKGTQQEAIKYCSKEETRVRGPFQEGSPKSQGRRTDLLNRVNNR